jgi:hypothetical protein
MQARPIDSSRRGFHDPQGEHPLATEPTIAKAVADRVEYVPSPGGVFGERGVDGECLEDESVGEVVLVEVSYPARTSRARVSGDLSTVESFGVGVC